jgi:hypothetical protein
METKRPGKKAVRKAQSMRNVVSGEMVVWFRCGIE